MVWLWAACFAQANVRTDSIAQIRRDEMPLASVRLERGNPCWQGVFFEGLAHLRLESPIGIFCGGDPVNSFDPDGRLSFAVLPELLNAQAQGPVNMVNLFCRANAGATVNVSQFLAYGNQNPNAQIVGNDLGSQFAQLGQAQAQGYQGSSAFFGSDMNYVDANGFSHVSFCMSCHDPTDPVAMLNNQAAFNTVNTSIPAFVAQNALALHPRRRNRW